MKRSIRKMLCRIGAAAATVVLLGSGMFVHTAVLPDVSLTVYAETSEANVFGDFEYRLLDDGTIALSGYKGEGGEVKLPSEIDGKSVTIIGENCFWECNSMTSVTIPNSIVSIEKSAFCDCDNLDNVVIPDSVKKIGEFLLRQSFSAPRRFDDFS